MEFWTFGALDVNNRLQTLWLSNIFFLVASSSSRFRKVRYALDPFFLSFLFCFPYRVLGKRCCFQKKVGSYSKVRSSALVLNCRKQGVIESLLFPDPRINFICELFDTTGALNGVHALNSLNRVSLNIKAQNHITFRLVSFFYIHWSFPLLVDFIDCLV